MSQGEVNVSYQGTGYDKEVLQQAGNELGMAAEEIARIIVEAQFIKGIIQLVSFALVVITFVAAYYLAEKKLKGMDYTEEKKNDEPPRIVLSIMSAVVLGLIVTIGTIVLQDIFLKIFAPEYMAIKDTIDMIQEATG